MRKQYHTRTVGEDKWTWDIHRLVRLAVVLPTIAVPLSQISEADEIWWYQDARDIPTPRSIAKHMALVEQTDLDHPILLCSEGRLMDGMHRVVKALLQNHITINAVRFDPTPAPDYVNISPEALSYEAEEV